MPKHDVFANRRNIIHKGSKDKAFATAPDVCKTPPGPVPIPYPNISFSKDLKKGSKSVKINGQPAALQKSNFSKSIGDQAGVAKGIISGTVGDKTEFVNYSFDVQIEGQGVVRHGDTTLHNKKNTLGMVLGSSTAPSKIDNEHLKCPYCGKKEHDFARKWGNHVGNGQLLRKNIIERIEDHPWYTGPNSLQAHHLICSEAMDDDDWSDYARLFGYSINHKNNGVMLPYSMELACQLHVPVHRGNHDKGMAEGVSYPDRITTDLKKIKEKVKAGQYCENPKALVEKLDRYSKYILGKIDKFQWTISADGMDYKAGGNGCAGVSSLTKKPNQPCSYDRNHKLARYEQRTIIPRKSEPLEIGK